MTANTTKLLLSLVRTELIEADTDYKLDLVQALQELSKDLEKFNPVEFAKRFNLIILENFDYFYSDDTKDYKEEMEYLSSIGNITEIELAEVSDDNICLSVTDIDSKTYLFSKTNFII